MANSTRADVYALGLPPEAFARAPRLVEGVVFASGTIQLRAHGLATNAPIMLALLSQSIPGATASALPAGLSEGTPYFAQPTSSDAFKVSTTSGGSPVASFGNAGVGVFGVLVDHGAYLDQAIDAADTLIAAFTVAHQAPLNSSVLKVVSAYLAARIYITAHAFGNPTFAKLMEPPKPIGDMIDKLFDLWVHGAPLPAGSSDATPTVVENSAELIELEGRGFLDSDCNGALA